MASSFLRRAVKGAFAAAGYDVQWQRRVAPAHERESSEAQAERARRIAEFFTRGGRKVHYGAGKNLLRAGWLNIDIAPRPDPNYVHADLTERHPLPDASIDVSYAEDFLEHLDQEQSLRFLIEAYRVLRPGGVLRLSFPGLEGVLRGAYTPPLMESARAAAKEVYAAWGHKHFYSLEELRTVARHIGFRDVVPVEHGRSTYPELRGLDRREDQIGLNTYAELVK